MPTLEGRLVRMRGEGGGGGAGTDGCVFALVEFVSCHWLLLAGSDWIATSGFLLHCCENVVFIYLLFRLCAGKRGGFVVI